MHPYDFFNLHFQIIQLTVQLSTYYFHTNIQSMPPKKKQEQIDLSTLPECKSLNIFLYCKGRQERAKKILTKIDSKFEKMLFHVKRAAVLDHAKQKGIYVDPQSLTDKQKKDPKFMQTVCTELTPQVLAKATDSYINNQNVKIRLEKKVLLEKPETAEIQKNKNIDCLYVFDDFPSESADFEALATANQGVKFIFVIDPKISWASAPEQPEPAQNPDEEPNQPDEQYQQFKRMKQAEILTPEDQKYEKTIQEQISKLRNERKKASNGSLFRNTVIEYIKCSVDPYTQDASIDQVTNLIIPTSEQLLQSSVEFNAWKKDKNAEKLPQKQANSLSVSSIKSSNPSVDKTIQVLSSLIQKFKPAGAEQKNDDQHIDFSNFSFDVAPAQPKRVKKNNQKVTKTQYLSYNQQKQREERDFIKQILKNTRYPGIDRFMMPELPLKSQGLRKQYRSSFGQFLPAGLSFQDFERKMNILFLQSAAKEADEQRTYDFSNKIYEEQHTRESLIRQLNKAMLFDESTVTIKYNQNNDKLYLCLLYKNPARRMSKKVWQCNWKVLPNLQNWLKFFKDNQTNLNNTHYYDIDYELIGNVQEEANVWTAKDSGVIVRKKSTVAGKKNTMLYCLSSNNTGDLVFGLRNRENGNEFYAQNQIALITQTQNANDKTKSVFVTFKDGSIIQFKQNGDTLIRKNNEKPRLITREGYTIIYNQDKKNVILHPNGGITHPPGSYVNPSGRGLNHGRLEQVSTLRKLTETGQLITKRDDSTVIIEENDKKWIKFEDKTQYLHSNNQITIEKSEYPRFKVLGNKKINVSYNGLEVTSEKSEAGFVFNINFTRICTNNRSELVFSSKEVHVFDGKTQTPYICSIDEPSISKSWQDQSLTVTFNGSKYQRNPKKLLDPQEDEENFNEEDILKSDYIEPRVFVISNDNTGVQLLSDNQLQKGYFEIFQQNKSENPNEIKRSEVRQIPHPEAANKSILFGVVPIPQTAELNKKTIEHIPVDLDIFKNEPQNKNSQPQDNLLQVRSIIKHQKLTKEDRDTIASILSKRAEHQARSQKQDNQFGYKPKNDPSTKERYESKRRVIEFRKLKEEQILSQVLKNQATKLYDKQTQERVKRIENINKQMQIMKKLSKKKTLIISYNWREPPMIQEDENLQYYNQQSSFYTNYFETAEGKKALNQMPEWVFRPKQNKKKQELDPEIQSQLNATMNKTKKQQDLMNATNQKLSYKQQSERNQRYDTVEPELKPSPVIYIKPSVFTQREIDQQRFAFESQKKAYDYHERKRKDFDVYGKDRKQKMEVPSLMRTQPVSQLNQKYLVTQAPVDKKVKISSMKNKLTSQASNMTEMRKQGPHANLIRTIDKGNDYSKLLEKRTMMVQADLNDRLQRDIQINPIEANFGLVRQGGNYELKIEIKNEDVLAQRIHLKKPKSIFCKVQMVEMGPIALGMTRKISVLLKAGPEITGKFTDEFDIVTKHEIYHIPISAQILSKNQFESSGAILSRSIRQFEQIGKKKREELPPIKGNQ